MNFSLDFFSLKGKIAMITGGNSGIGREIALALAAAGADIFIYAHSNRDMESLIEEVAKLGKEIHFSTGDLSKEETAMSAVSECIKIYGKIDILVNNAGTIKRSPLLEGSNEDWKAVLDINLSAVYYLSKTAAAEMVKQGHGKIINIASMLSFQGGKFVPSYTASKHGIAGLTKAFANELAGKNIQINAVAPGYIKTANTAPIRADEVREKEILNRIPAERWGETSDLTGGVVFLASKASDYINGHILAIDGGWLVR